MPSKCTLYLKIINLPHSKALIQSYVTKLNVLTLQCDAHIPMYGDVTYISNHCNVSNIVTLQSTECYYHNLMNIAPKSESNKHTPQCLKHGNVVIYQTQYRHHVTNIFLTSQCDKHFPTSQCDEHIPVLACVAL
jgi:hypothetical protein